MSDPQYTVVSADTLHNLGISVSAHMREGFVPSGSALQSAPGLYFHQPMVKYAGVATEKDRVSERIKLGNAEAVLHEIERSVDWQPVNRGKIGTARRLINEVLEALK